MHAKTLDIDSAAPAPWYRQRWPWFLALGPGIVVVAAFVTLWLAIRSDDGLVADDYYKRGLAINQKLERSERAAALDLGADLNVAADGTAHLVLSGTGADAAPPVLLLRLTHPTRAGLDRMVELMRGADGSYTGRITSAVTGRWLVSVETTGWRLPAVEVAGRLDHVRLGATSR